MITAIFGDVRDNYVLCRSQAEMDDRIAEQMRLMVPERAGADTEEDPHYGLFGAAYLTQSNAVMLGLKSYDFTITDAPARRLLDLDTLKRVFGAEVLEKVKENGFQITGKNIPETREVVQDLLKTAHAFLLQVGDASETTTFWTPIFGPERIVELPSVEYLPEVRAAIIGLTEGVLNLQNLRDFLKDHCKLSKPVADKIREAVAGIPLGAQAALPNWKKIPLQGALFAKKGDLWPIGFDANGEPVSTGAASPGKKPKKEKIWL